MDTGFQKGGGGSPRGGGGPDPKDPLPGSALIGTNKARAAIMVIS